MKKKVLIVFLSLCSSFFTLCEGQYSVLYNFNNALGYLPSGSLTLYGNVLYGMTEYGGTYNDGCIFTMDTNGGGYRDLFDFNIPYGYYPLGSLTLSGGRLYGVTQAGGFHNQGCIFSIDTNGGAYTDLHDFWGSGGSGPMNGPFMPPGGKFYGMTLQGGIYNDGCIYSIDTNGNNYKVLYSFNDTNGAFPYGSLKLSGSVLFGMTHNGGPNNDGVVFSIDTSGKSFKVLLNFNNTNGKCPEGDVTILGGLLFGMTNEGGTNNAGVLFSIDTNGSAYKYLHEFNGSGGNPYSYLTFSGSKLYGMTVFDGVHYGTIFSFDTSTNMYTDLFNFNGFDGAYPTGSLTQFGDIFYGMTPNGGANTDGVIFKYMACTLSAISIVSTNVTCNGLNNGSAIGTLSGGALPYTYVWSGGHGTTDTARNLSAGTYTLNVTDNNGCASSATVSITQPTPLVAYIGSSTGVSCNGGCNGTAAIYYYGGTPPYTYSMLHENSPSTVTGLCAGAYTYTVTDGNGCSATTSVVITQPNTLTVSANTTANVSCNGETNGSASSTVSGGTKPYTYSWSNSETTANISSLGAGTYTLTVSDSCGASVTATTAITQPTTLILVADNYVVYDTGCYGVAYVEASGGNGPYRYVWRPSGKTTDTIKGLCTGHYCCKVTDHNGCVDSACTNVTTGIKNIVSGKGQISIYPNPNNGAFTLESGVENGESLVELYNALGQNIYTRTLNLTGGSKNLININDQPSGIYFYRVSKSNGILLGQGKILIQK